MTRHKLLYMAHVLPEWYEAHKRDLPWRGTGNPYDVWLSEIMLQQTRVEAVKAYFLRFKEALPEIAALAACPDDRLMKLWEGLGYYSRVRNLRKCAQILVSQYGGQLPADYHALLKLPGIGSYTAGAIASIAFSLPVPAVDGNVLRVYARITGDASDIALPQTKKSLEAVLTDVIAEASKEKIEKNKRAEGDGKIKSSENAEKSPAVFSPGIFNQALMELGATVCVPNGAPDCTACPVRNICTAHEEGRIAELPVKSGKKPHRIEERTVVILQDGDRFLIQKRPDSGLLAGLYEFPSLPGKLPEKEVLAAVEKLGFDPVHIRKLPDAKHIFTHVEWRMQGYLVKLAAESRAAACRLTGNKLMKNRLIENQGKTRRLSNHELTEPADAEKNPEEMWIKPEHLFVTKEETAAVYALPSAFGAFAKELQISQKQK